MSFARLREMLGERLDALRMRLRQQRGAVGTRLTAGYVLLLVVSVASLYGLADWQLGRVLQARDRSVIATELGEMARDYTQEGTGAIREEVAEQPTGPAGRPLHIRLVGPQGRTLLPEGSGAPRREEASPEQKEKPPASPGDWPPGALRRLEEAALPQPPSAAVTWRRVPASGDENEDEGMEVATRRLPDGSILQAGASVEPRAEVLEQFRSLFVLAALPVLVLALLGGLALARHVLRPLRELARVAGRIASTGEVTERVPLRGSGDELDTLAYLFNDMLARVERLVEGLRETLDHVAHDLRTPMTRLRGRAEMALQRKASSEGIPSEGSPSDKRSAEAAYREALSDSLEAAAQVQSTLDAIMDEAEAQAGTLPLHLERVSLKDVARDVVDLYEYVAEERGVALYLKGPPDVTARADAGRLRQAVANLVDNAIKYTAAGGEVTVSISAKRVADGERRAVIHVRDTGAGISEGDLPRIWDRLYRGDRSRSTRGLGLGLSLVRSFVEAHGGTVEVQSTLGEGSVFSIHLVD